MSSWVGFYIATYVAVRNTPAYLWAL